MLRLAADLKRPGDRTPREKPQEGQEEQNADEPARQAVQVFEPVEKLLMHDIIIGLFKSL